MEHVLSTTVPTWKLFLALVFFSVTYLIIITEFRNRAVAALEARRASSLRACCRLTRL
ncbi:hypothetical protein [Calditerricola satsumensis]|uniref:hypothetical protein n=1 Tax=Calditerricola satsumensis TaxID=373054 RepID=UPI0012EE6DBE|nr:hypothetical protein [Calditerricola satsumensis]